MRRQAKETKARTRAVGYVRVSTDEQGISLEAQRAKLEAYAQLYDLDLVAVLTDEGASAKSLDRPRLQQALGMLEADEADALLVANLDRLTRSVRDLGLLLERYFDRNRWALMSVSENIDARSAVGRLVLNVLGSVAQWERETIGERTSVALRHKQSKGEAIGGPPPFGFRKVGTDVKVLEPRQDEQTVITEAKRLHVGGLSLRKVASKLEASGHLSRDGRRFHPEQVRRMVA